MKMKKADVAVAIYIMAAIIMFIVPIPSWLLDILLAINISVALTILFDTRAFEPQRQLRSGKLPSQSEVFLYLWLHL